MKHFMILSAKVHQHQGINSTCFIAENVLHNVDLGKIKSISAKHMSWTMKSPHRCERVWMSLGNYALLAFNLNPFENGLLHATITYCNLYSI